MDGVHVKKFDYAHRITAGLQQLCVRPSESSLLSKTTIPQHKINIACSCAHQSTEAGLWRLRLKSSKMLAPKNKKETVHYRYLDTSKVKIDQKKLAVDLDTISKLMFETQDVQTAHLVIW